MVRQANLEVEVMTMKTMFDVIFAHNPEVLKVALEAHQCVPFDDAEEEVIKQFIQKKEC